MMMTWIQSMVAIIRRRKHVSHPGKRGGRGQSIIEYLVVTAALIGVISLVVAPALAASSCALMTTAIRRIGQ